MYIISILIYIYNKKLFTIYIFTYTYHIYTHIKYIHTKVHDIMKINIDHNFGVHYIPPFLPLDIQNSLGKTSHILNLFSDSLTIQQ